jgi:hypothetical protein
MQEKYEKLFYEFEPQETHWGDWCHSPQAYFRGERDMPGAAMNVGFQVFKAPMLLETEPHFHREDEYLMFLDAKLPDVFSSWDAEVHFYVGKTLDTMEKIVITEPTVIKLPKSWWHSPLNFVRVDKPLLFQAAQLSGRTGLVKYVERQDGERQYLYIGDEAERMCVMDPSKRCTICGYCFAHPEKRPPLPYSYVKWTVVNEDGVTSYTDTGAYDPSKAPMGPDCVIRPGYTSKPYSDATKLKVNKPPLSPELAKCVLAIPKEETFWGPWCPSPQAYFRGEIYMEEATYHINWQVFTAPNNMENPHIHQGAEEYIYFMGADPMNIFDFDCEIEMFFGDDPDHMESRLITKPTVIRIPANVWHCPILFRKMNKPILFHVGFLSGVWGTINIEPEEKNPELPEGEADSRPFGRKRTYTYMGDNVRFCKFHPEKRCIICGACFPKPEEYLKE